MSCYIELKQSYEASFVEDEGRDLNVPYFSIVQDGNDFKLAQASGALTYVAPFKTRLRLMLSVEHDSVDSKVSHTISLNGVPQPTILPAKAHTGFTVLKLKQGDTIVIHSTSELSTKYKFLQIKMLISPF